MSDNEFYVELVKFMTRFLLARVGNQSETLKIITIAVQAALQSESKKEK